MSDAPLDALRKAVMTAPVEKLQALVDGYQAAYGPVPADITTRVTARLEGDDIPALTKAARAVAGFFRWGSGDPLPPDGRTRLGAVDQRYFGMSLRERREYLARRDAAEAERLAKQGRMEDYPSYKPRTNDRAKIHDRGWRGYGVVNFFGQARNADPVPNPTGMTSEQFRNQPDNKPARPLGHY